MATIERPPAPGRPSEDLPRPSPPGQPPTPPIPSGPLSMRFIIGMALTLGFAGLLSLLQVQIGDWFVLLMLAGFFVLAALAKGRLSVLPVAIVVGGLLWAHLYGWQRSGIDLPLLARQMPEVQRFLTQLVQPDIIFFDQKFIQITDLGVAGSATPVENAPPAQASASVDAMLVTGMNKDPEPDPESERYNAQITASPGMVTPGQTFTVSGSGLRPNTETRIIWQSTGVNASLQLLGVVTTDAEGRFEAQVQAPPDEDRVVNTYGFPNTVAIRQSWDVGNPHISDTLGYVVDKVIETIFLALMGTSFAVVLGIPLSFMAARNLMAHNPIGTAVYGVTRTILNLLRSIEVVILAIIFAATVGLGSFAGVLALTVHSIASLGKLYSEAIESIDHGPIEAITATGANRLQVIMYAVVPQFIPQFIAFTLYRWDINVRMATIIGIVGGGGIGLFLQETIQKLAWNQAATALWVIALVVIAIDWTSSKIRAAVI